MKVHPQDARWRCIADSPLPSAVRECRVTSRRSALTAGRGQRWKRERERCTEFLNGRISTVFNNVRGTSRPWEWIGFAAMVQRNDVRIRPQSPNNLMIACSLSWNARSPGGRTELPVKSIVIRCGVILVQSRVEKELVISMSMRMSAKEYAETRRVRIDVNPCSGSRILARVITRACLWDSLGCLSCRGLKTSRLCQRTRRCVVIYCKSFRATLFVCLCVRILDTRYLRYLLYNVGVTRLMLTSRDSHSYLPPVSACNAYFCTLRVTMSERESIRFLDTDIRFTLMSMHVFLH